jgi:hypothetical protein
MTRTSIVFANDSVWPHEAELKLSSRSSVHKSMLEEACLYERCGHYLKAEHSAIAAFACASSKKERSGCLQLLARLRLLEKRDKDAKQILLEYQTDRVGTNYGPQRSVDPEDIQPGGQHLNRFREVLKQQTRTCHQELAGTVATGSELP